MPDPGRLYPVCCAADIPATVGNFRTIFLNARSRLTLKTVDHFIEENQMYHDQLLCHFVFVDSLTETYTEKTEIGDMEDGQNRTATSPDSPFKGKSPAECHQLLRHLRRNGSDIDYCSFVVMDERSLADGTVLLVNAPGEDEEGEVQYIRVTFEIADSRLSGYFMADSDMAEDRAVAERTEDGVLRGSSDHPFLQTGENVHLYTSAAVWAASLQ
jgi:hypothetical protein